MINIKFWTWAERHREKVAQQRMQLSDEWITVLTTSITEGLRHTQIGWSGNMHVTHAQRPPAPRPARITVTYVMQDGREYRTYIPLNGQAEWTESYPTWLSKVYNGEEPPPQYIRYSLGYNDGGML